MSREDNTGNLVEPVATFRKVGKGSDLVKQFGGSFGTRVKRGEAFG